MLVRLIIMLVFCFAMLFVCVILLLFRAASAFSVVLAVFDAMLLLFNAISQTLSQVPDPPPHQSSKPPVPNPSIRRLRWLP